MSWFVQMALLDGAKDTGAEAVVLMDRAGWAILLPQLGVKGRLNQSYYA